MSEPRIVVRDLTLGFGDRVLMEGASFDVGEGEVFAIVGGSGTGKTTLLRCLCGLDAPRAGTIRIRGIGDPTIRPQRPRFGVTFQSSALFGSMTVADNLRLTLDTWTDVSAAEADALVHAKLALVGVEHVAAHRPSEISGGQAKRVAIARSLMLDPDLLFLDEPSSGLDPITSRELDDLLAVLNATLGVTIVMVTHVMSSVFAIAHRCLLLQGGGRGIVAEGPPRQLRDEPPNDYTERFFTAEGVA